MNLVILCAGYAQRLQGLGRRGPKALLPVQGTPLLDSVIQHTARHPELKTVNVVANAAHFPEFETWLTHSENAASMSVDVRLFNDGSSCPEERLGAVGDLEWVIKTANLLNEDLVVVAGDTLFSESQNAFIDRSKGKPCTTGTFDTGNIETVKKIASIETDADGRITHFEEKPSRPKSTVGGIALYYFRSDCLPMVGQYLAEGNNPDQAGHLIAWLAKRLDVYGVPVKGDWIDIGTPESYRSANPGKPDTFSNRL